MTSYPAFCDHILHQNELVAAGICHGDTWNLIFINNMLGEILKLSPGRMDDEPFLPRLTRCGFDEVEESLSEPHGGELIAHHKEGSMYIIRWKSVSIDDSAGGEQVRLITMSKIPVDQINRVAELPWQELLLFTPFQPGTDNPYGVSLLRSMPFLSGILLKIYQALGQNWERAGNLRFAVVCRPGERDGLSAQERGQQIAREWSAAMEAGRDGRVRDFVAVGDVDIKVIGADNQVLDSEVPVRQILEQVVAKTGIPPFMLGLSWSSTERMSSQQADMLTTEITAIRRTITPVVERICRLWLRMHGYTCGFEVLWEDINLQDEVEDARAALYLEQARKLRLENDAAEAAAFHTRREV